MSYTNLDVYKRQAQALRIDRKQQALQAILAGDASTENFNQLDDDWNIEERSVAALDSWGLGQFPLSYPMHLLTVYPQGLGNGQRKMCIRDSFPDRRGK